MIRAVTRRSSGLGGVRKKGDTTCWVRYLAHL